MQEEETERERTTESVDCFNTSSWDATKETYHLDDNNLHVNLVHNFFFLLKSVRCLIIFFSSLSLTFFYFILFSHSLHLAFTCTLNDRFIFSSHCLVHRLECKNMNIYLYINLYSNSYIFILIWFVSLDTRVLLYVFSFLFLFLTVFMCDTLLSSITLLSPNNNTPYLEPPSPTPSTSSAMTSNSFAVHQF